MFVDEREDMYGLDAAILMNAKVWEASGHTGAGFVTHLWRILKLAKDIEQITYLKMLVYQLKV